MKAHAIPLALAGIAAAAAAGVAHAEAWFPYLQEFEGTTGTHLGTSIAVESNGSGVRYVYVGMPDAADGAKAEAGRVDVFVPAPNGVAYYASLFATSAQAGAHFGASIAARGGHVAIAAPDYNDVGGAGANAGYVEFFNDSGSIVPIGTATGGGGNFGSAVAMSADFAVVSSVNASNGDGCIFTFQYNLQTTHFVLFPANPVACGSAGEKLGASLAILETGPSTFLAAAGAPAASQGANALAGAAHVFFPSNGALLEVGTLAAQNPAFLDAFGTSIGIDSGYVYVGATGRDNGAGRTGSVTIFKPAFLIGYDYVNEYFPSPPTTIGGHCGASLNVDPVQPGFILGCPDSDGLVAGEGTARVYRPFDFLGTTIWLDSVLSFGTQPHAADRLGASVDLLGSYAFAGAPDAHVSGQTGNGGFKTFRPDAVFGDGFDP